MENSSMRRILAVGLTFALVLSMPYLRAIVMFDSIVSVPISRLINNTRRFVKAKPKNSAGYYLLGRLHSFAFAGNTKTDMRKDGILYDEAGLPLLPFLEPVPREARTAPGNILPAAARWHLTESLRNYRRATELQPKQPMAYLGLGWMLEQG